MVKTGWFRFIPSDKKVNFFIFKAYWYERDFPLAKATKSKPSILAKLLKDKQWQTIRRKKMLKKVTFKNTMIFSSIHQVSPLPM